MNKGTSLQCGGQFGSSVFLLPKREKKEWPQKTLGELLSFPSTLSPSDKIFLSRAEFCRFFLSPDVADGLSFMVSLLVFR